MASIKLLPLFLLNCIFVVPGAVFGHNLDALVSRANIYYQTPGKAGGELILSDVKQLPTKTNIKMIVHGYTCNRFHFSVLPLKNAYLAKGIQNVLLADWGDVAILEYPTSRNAAGPVGKYFGKQLKEFIDKHGIDPSDVHIIGHSLGAHIAGNIGEYFNGRLGRVTGLDPALPLFTPLSSDSLHRSAAKFVDVIHTDIPVFGDGTPRGTVDFYPNFGIASQPGCAFFEQFSCSHFRAVLLFAESIGQPKNFPAIPCSLNAITTMNENACRREINNGTSNGEVYMGEEVSRSATGYYYHKTSHAPPYGMGANTKARNPWLAPWAFPG